MLVLPVLMLLAVPAAPANAATCDAKPFAFNTAPKKPVAAPPKPKPVPPQPKPAQTASTAKKQGSGKPGCDPITGK